MTGERVGVSGYAVDLVLDGLPFSCVVMVPTRALQLAECWSSQVSEEEPLTGGCLDWEPRHWRHTCGHSSSKKRGTGAASSERGTTLEAGDAGEPGRLWQLWELLEGSATAEPLGEERPPRCYSQIGQRSNRAASDWPYESCLSEWHL